MKDSNKELWHLAKGVFVVFFFGGLGASLAILLFALMTRFYYFLAPFLK